MSDWLEIWGQPSGLFGPRTTTAQDAVRVSEAALSILGLGPGSVVLDYGCGPALGLGPLLEAGVRVLLYDRSPHFQELARRTYEQKTAVSVLSDLEFATLAPDSLDAVLLCSVLQYLTDVERTALLARSADVLKSGGVLALIDVVPGDYSLASDLLATLRADLLADRLWRAPGNLLALGASVVRRARTGLRLRRYGDEELRDLLREAGFTSETLPRNFKPNPSRHTWLARPSLSSSQ